MSGNKKPTILFKYVKTFYYKKNNKPIKVSLYRF